MQGSGNPWAVASLAPEGDGKERLGVRQSDPTPLVIQPGVRERALIRSPKPQSCYCLTCGLGRVASSCGSCSAHAQKG